MTESNARIGVPNNPSDGSAGVARYKEPPQERKDEVTIDAQRALIGSLQARLQSQQRRIEDLERYMGSDRRSLLDEIDRLMLNLRYMNETWEPKKS